MFLYWTPVHHGAMHGWLCININFNVSIEVFIVTIDVQGHTPGWTTNEPWSGKQDKLSSSWKTIPALSNKVLGNLAKVDERTLACVV